MAQQMVAVLPLSFRTGGSDKGTTRQPWHAPVISHSAREIFYFLQGHWHKDKEQKNDTNSWHQPQWHHVMVGSRLAVAHVAVGLVT